MYVSAKKTSSVQLRIYYNELKLQNLKNTFYMKLNQGRNATDY